MNAKNAPTEIHPLILNAREIIAESAQYGENDPAFLSGIETLIAAASATAGYGPSMAEVRCWITECPENDVIDSYVNGILVSSTPDTATFTLTITLGNDAMQDYDDVARALEVVTGKLDTFYREETDPTPGDGKDIRDTNGKTVGAWSVTA